MGGPDMMLAQSFLQAADTNKDSKLSALEFNHAFAKWFGQWDADKSAALSETELGDGLGQLFRPPDFVGQSAPTTGGKAEKKAVMATANKSKARRK